MKNIDVLILSGGQGTRLREIVSDRPKPMAQINGQPFLDILINNVSKYEFRRFILCVGYMGEVIENYYTTRNGQQEILFSCENMPLGTGGAVKSADKLINSNPFLVMNGDSFCPVDLSHFFEFHQKREALLSMVVVESKKTDDVGTVVMNGSQRINRFEEKNENSGKAFVNAGIYLFDRQVLSLIPSDTKCSLEYDLFPKLVDRKFYGFVTKEKLTDIGTPERYEYAKKFIGI